MRIRDEHPRLFFPELLETVFRVKILKFFDADPDPGSGIFSTMDSRSAIRDGKIRIRDPGKTSRIRNTAYYITLF
jgi:hypothetical protein